MKRSTDLTMLAHGSLHDITTHFSWAPGSDQGMFADIRQRTPNSTCRGLRRPLDEAVVQPECVVEGFPLMCMERIRTKFANGSVSLRGSRSDLI